MQQFQFLGGHHHLVGVAAPQVRLRRLDLLIDIGQRGFVRCWRGLRAARIERRMLPTELPRQRVHQIGVRIAGHHLVDFGGLDRAGRVEGHPITGRARPDQQVLPVVGIHFDRIGSGAIRCITQTLERRIARTRRTSHGGRCVCPAIHRCRTRRADNGWFAALACYDGRGFGTGHWGSDQLRSAGRRDSLRLGIERRPHLHVRHRLPRPRDVVTESGNLRTRLDPSSGCAWRQQPSHFPDFAPDEPSALDQSFDRQIGEPRSPFDRRAGAFENAANHPAAKRRLVGGSQTNTNCSDKCPTFGGDREHIGWIKQHIGRHTEGIFEDRRHLVRQAHEPFVHRLVAGELRLLMPVDPGSFGGLDVRRAGIAVVVPIDDPCLKRRISPIRCLERQRQRWKERDVVIGVPVAGTEKW